ncbi:hypothetical protein ACLOJK_033101 [Asimina triloba]
MASEKIGWGPDSMEKFSGVTQDPETLLAWKDRQMIGMRNRSKFATVDEERLNCIQAVVIDLDHQLKNLWNYTKSFDSQMQTQDFMAKISINNREGVVREGVDVNLHELPASHLPWFEPPNSTRSSPLISQTRKLESSNPCFSPRIPAKPYLPIPLSNPMVPMEEVVVDVVATEPMADPALTVEPAEEKNKEEKPAKAKAAKDLRRRTLQRQRSQRLHRVIHSIWRWSPKSSFC